MKPQFRRIEAALLPLPYSWMRKFYNAVCQNKPDDIKPMLDELDSAQMQSLHDYHKGFIEFHKRRGVKFLDEKEADSEANQTDDASGA